MFQHCFVIFRECIEPCHLYCNNIVIVFHKGRIIVNKPLCLLWFLKVIWLNTPPEDGTRVVKHVGVSILDCIFCSNSAFCRK
jgi:hypothetical protein